MTIVSLVPIGAYVVGSNKTFSIVTVWLMFALFATDDTVLLSSADSVKLKTLNSRSLPPVSNSAFFQMQVL